MKILFFATVLHLSYLASAEVDLSNVELPDIDIDDFSVIKDKCDKAGGNGTYEKLKASKESLQTCVTNFVDVNVLKNEVEESKKTGSMDEVFGKYCKKRSTLTTCVTEFTDNLRNCLSSEEKNALNITLDILKQLGEFACFKDGDRIAMFIAEGGVECIKSRTAGIQNCVNSTFKVDPKTVNTNSIPNLLIDKQKCDDLGKLQNCVVEELEKCKDSTPANIVDALFRFVKRSACTNKNKRSLSFHSIMKRNAAVVRNVFDLDGMREKAIEFFKGRCAQNAPNGGFEAYLASVNSASNCIKNKTRTNSIINTPPNEFKEYITECTASLIENLEACLPEHEKYWPKFYRGFLYNLIDFIHNNKNEIINVKRVEFINCFQNFKEQSAKDELSKCFHFEDDINLKKEIVCSRLATVKTCVGDQLKKKCIRDIAIHKLTDDFFKIFTSSCKAE